MGIMNQTTFKLGTRKSLLAMAQSTWVARELERLNPGIRIELVGIETRGDVVLDKPLSQIEGKEFFTAELDHALMRGEVDLTVHSMKDLSLERPAAITLGAVPKRELPHDVILFNEHTLDRIREGAPIRIGTSSPRRLALVPEFLLNALPRFHPEKAPVLRFVEIRGNVNTRLSRIHEPEGSDRKLDAVVLAFAGLERLTRDKAGLEELTRLTQETRMMVLPLRACPSAPAQGALAIETRTEHLELRNLLATLHHPPTLEAVQAERAVLEEWGGGCHQKLGASRVASGALFVKGIKPSGEHVDETRGALLPESSAFVKIEASDVFDFESIDPTSEALAILESSPVAFIAHSRAFEQLRHESARNQIAKKRVWVSGTRSWFKLARSGVWVEGSLDCQGFQAFSSFRGKNLLRVPESPLPFLSHAESPDGAGAYLVATYQHRFREIPRKFLESESIYWSSGLPFEALWSKLGPESFQGKTHACGPGRTAELLRDRLAEIGQQPVLLSME
jgi:hydroxymethylbilane synthase